MYISIEQALGIYDELFKAYIGENGYGGNTAEIYTYRLLPDSPIYTQTWASIKPGDFSWEETLSLEKKAAQALLDIIDIFILHNNCTVTVEDPEVAVSDTFISSGTWLENVLKDKYRFAHRIHVRVQKL